VDFSLSPQQEAIRQEMVEICSDFSDDYWRELDRRGEYPEAFLQTMLESGWLGVLIPEEYGGKGLGITEAALVIEEISRAGGNSLTVHAQIYNVGMLLRHGTEEQRRRWLPDIAAGKSRFLAFGLTEAVAGQNTTAIETSAVRDGDSYVINGEKNWVSRFQHSDLMLVIARTTPLAEAPKKTAGMSAFLVELPTEGIEVTPVETMMNFETNRVRFTDLRVPAANLIGQEGEAFKYVLSGVNGDRIAASSAAIGDARYFVSKATAYACEREVFDRPIGQNQAIQLPIAQAHTATEAASLMRFHAASLFDRGEPCGTQANMAKFLASEAAWNAANVAMTTFGGNAFAKEYDIERKFRETRVFLNAPGSNALVLSYIGQHVLGMPRTF